MLRTAHRELRQRLGGAEFFLWQLPEGEHRLACDRGLTPIRLPFQRKLPARSARSRKAHQLLWSVAEVSKTADPRQIALLVNPRKLFSRACMHHLNGVFDEFDALIDISGFVYGDSWGLCGFYRILPLADFCRRHQKPMIFLPQAWGGFHDRGTARAIHELLSTRQVMFYARDTRSRRHLEELLGRPEGTVPLCADIAFRFKGATAVEAGQIVRKMGCSMTRPIVGVAPNRRVYQRVRGRGQGNRYVQAFARLVKYCLDHYEVDIVLQANEIACTPGQTDDRYLCGLIAAAVNRSGRCFMTREPLTAELTKALIGRFEFLISSRYHSSVFAFSQGIPGMGVSWSHKYRELFSLFGMEDCIQECQDLDADALIATFMRGWEMRRTNVPRIHEKAQQLRAEVGTLFDDVATCIRGEGTQRHVRDN